MAGKVRFGKGDEAGYTALARKRMPDRTDRLESKVRNYRIENRAKHGLITQPFGGASRCFDQPFSPDDH
jgi:hypothetical protein